MMKNLLVIGLVILLTGCSTLSGTHTQVVKAGNHKMEGNRIQLLNEKIVRFSIIFNKSFVWPVPEKNGFTKITGIGFFTLLHGKNSSRLVYINKKNDKREAWSYFYKNGYSPQIEKGQKKKLLDIVIGKRYYGTAGYKNGEMFVEIEGRRHAIPYSGKGIPYRQNLYVGGTYVVDHDVTITITYY